MDNDNDGTLFDIAIALTHVDGDRELLAELSAMFLDDYPRMIEQAREAAEKGDPSTLERVAHTLKGRLAFFGIHAAIEAAAELETAGRNNDLRDAAAIMARIEDVLKNVLQEFERLVENQHR